MELDRRLIELLGECAGLRMTESRIESHAAELGAIVGRVRAFADEDLGKVAPALTFRAEWNE